MNKFQRYFVNYLGICATIVIVNDIVQSKRKNAKAADHQTEIHKQLKASHVAYLYVMDKVHTGAYAESEEDQMETDYKFMKLVNREF